METRSDYIVTNKVLSFFHNVFFFCDLCLGKCSSLNPDINSGSACFLPICLSFHPHPRHPGPHTPPQPPTTHFTGALSVLSSTLQSKKAVQSIPLLFPCLNSQSLHCYKGAQSSSWRQYLHREWKILCLSSGGSVSMLCLLPRPIFLHIFHIFTPSLQ